MSSPRYEIRRRIGQGGLGAVYAAYDNSLNREVAIKRVLADTTEDVEQLKEKLKQEAKTLSALQHPNIVTVYDVGQDEEGPFLVMELLKGETLDALIERGALPMNDFRDVVIQTLEGMVAANHSGLIHRDLKPANIMLRWLPNGKFQLKILDFGLAKFGAQPSLQTIDHSESILGSIYFMAPEQFERGFLDIRTDLYSMGGIYYYTLTTMYPFQGDTAAQVMASHLTNRYTPLQQLRPDLPPWVAGWLAWLMARDINDRPADPGEALKAFLEERPGPAHFTTTAPGVQGHRNLPPQLLPKKPTPGVNAPMLRPSGGVAIPSRADALRAGRSTAHSGPVTLSSADEVIGYPAGPVQVVRSGMSSGLKWTLFSLAAVAVLGGGGFLTKTLLDSNREKARAAEFEQITQAPDIDPNRDQIELMTDFLLSSDPAISGKAADALAKMKISPSLNQYLAEKLSGVTDSVPLANLVRVLGARGVDSTFQPILALAKSADPSVRQSAVTALAHLTSSSDLPNLLGLLPELPAEDYDRFIDSVVTVCEAMPVGQQRGRAPFSAYQQETDPARQRVLMTILAHLGAADALEEITKSLTSADKAQRAAAVHAMSEWPTGKPLKPLTELYKATTGTDLESAGLRKELASAMAKIAGRPAPEPQAETAAALIELIKATKERSEDTQLGTAGELAQALAKTVDPASEAYLNEVKAESAFQAVVSASLPALQKDLGMIIDIGDEGSLPAERATLLGPEGPEVKDSTVANWSNPENLASWIIRVDKPGVYRLRIDYSRVTPEAGTIVILAAAEPGIFRVPSTGSDTEFSSVSIGSVEFQKPGVYRLEARPGQNTPPDGFLRLKTVLMQRF